jgi:hypothetical protein
VEEMAIDLEKRGKKVIAVFTFERADTKYCRVFTPKELWNSLKQNPMGSHVYKKFQSHSLVLD